MEFGFTPDEQAFRDEVRRFASYAFTKIRAELAARGVCQ